LQVELRREPHLAFIGQFRKKVLLKGYVMLFATGLVPLFWSNLYAVSGSDAAAIYGADNSSGVGNRAIEDNVLGSDY
jgi:hypothetical protein